MFTGKLLCLAILHLINFLLTHQLCIFEVHVLTFDIINSLFLIMNIDNNSGVVSVMSFKSISLIDKMTLAGLLYLT